MLDQIAKIHSLVTFWVATFNFEHLVSTKECLIFDGSECTDRTAVGALGDWVFVDPIVDADFTIHFATGSALEGIHDNFGADDAVELIECHPYEPFLVVAGVGHFCCIALLINI